MLGFTVCLSTWQMASGLWPGCLMGNVFLLADGLVTLAWPCPVYGRRWSCPVSISHPCGSFLSAGSLLASVLDSKAPPGPSHHRHLSWTIPQPGLDSPGSEASGGCSGLMSLQLPKASRVSQHQGQHGGRAVLRPRVPGRTSSEGFPCPVLRPS
jgi:hypothetical protein